MVNNLIEMNRKYSELNDRLDNINFSFADWRYRANTSSSTKVMLAAMSLSMKVTFVQLFEKYKIDVNTASELPPSKLPDIYKEKKFILEKFNLYTAMLIYGIWADTFQKYLQKMTYWYRVNENIFKDIIYNPSGESALTHIVGTVSSRYDFHLRDLNDKGRDPLVVRYDDELARKLLTAYMKKQKKNKDSE